MDTAEQASPIVICFGEVLWDIFPEGRQPGGAPMNVAYHLRQLGIDSRIISATGSDAPGDELRSQLKEWGLPVNSCRVVPDKPTGTVIANIDADREAHYEIVQDVAWDYIAWQDADAAMVAESAAFVYGSLAARQEVSRHTLYRLLEAAPFRVFDINLRPPFFSPDVLRELLQKADLVKINQAELLKLTELLGKPFESEAVSMRLLQDTFSPEAVLLTRGSKGAVYAGGHTVCSFPAVPVQVQDTVGSGDAFLAGFLAGKVTGGTPEAAMINAITLGAFITTRSGACPPYTRGAFDAFKAAAAAQLRADIRQSGREGSRPPGGT